MSEYTMKKYRLDEIEQYRKMNYPETLCDVAEKQVLLFYQKHNDDTMMFRTATMNLLWMKYMADTSVVVRYSY